MDSILKNRFIAFILLICSAFIVFFLFILFDNNLNFNSIKSSCSSDKEVTKLISESDAIKIGSDLHKSVGNLYVTHGLRDCETVFTFDHFKMSEASSYDSYVYCKLKYDDNRAVLSSNGFLELVKYANAVSSDGEFYILAGDRGVNISYQGFELHVISIEEDKVIFKVDELYYDLDYGEEAPKDRSLFTTKTNDFIIVKEDGVWKVDSYTIAY